jgi:hypothetical protein
MTTITTPDLELRDLVAAGMTAQQIAEHFGCSRSVIYRRLSRLGLRARMVPSVPRSPRCKHGHDLTLPGARYGRNCARCHRKAMRDAQRRRNAARNVLGTRQPSSDEIISSHAAINQIFTLDDRLTRGDYLNQAEAAELRRTIAGLAARVTT